jgi:phospholipid-transporting ATPase
LGPQSRVSFILFSNFVPISLIVTVETVKLLQARLITLDPAMSKDDFSTRINCSNILEDLGIIEYIASDKTGTLTKNHLTLRQVSDGTLIYDSNSKNIP